MIRFAVLAVVVAGLCGACGSHDKATTPPPAATDDKAATPVAATPTDTAVKCTSDGPPAVDDPKFHLKPDEGTLEIGKVEAKAGAEAVAAIKLTPGSGYHISTDYPAKLTLQPPDGVKLAKAALCVGRGDKGDADALSEQALAFMVKATADKPGAYEVKGMFKFGVCDKDSCHPKRQPITITVAAN
jgi:hypothetical protein